MAEDSRKASFVSANDTGASPLGLAGNGNKSNMPISRSFSKIKPKRLWRQFSSDNLTAARMQMVTNHHDERKLVRVNDQSLEILEQQVSATSCSHIHATLEQMDNCDWSTLGTEYLQVPEGGTLGAATFGLIKGTVGPGILYLPRGFQIAGYAAAIPSIFFATSMYVYNAYRLFACWKVEHDKDITAYGKHPRTQLTFPELARRAFGPGLSKVVDVGIASLQFGICLTYLIFVPQNLFECTQALWGVEVDKSYFLLAMLAVEIPLSWIRDITKLTPTNVFATVLIAYGLISVVVLAVVHGLGTAGEENSRIFVSNLENLPAIKDTWFFFVGTSFFMMEGSITLLMPLNESIQRQEDRAAFPRTNQKVTAGIAIFYVVFSIICCGAFGDDIRTALTASLDGTLAITIQLAYSVAVVLTFPLQAFPAMEVLKNNLLGSDTVTNNDPLERNVLATLVILCLGVVAICAIDYLGNVVSILGSLFGIPLALIIPPLMHNILITDSPNSTRYMNNGSMVIGFMAMIVTSITTIISWDEGMDTVD